MIDLLTHFPRAACVILLLLLLGLGGCANNGLTQKQDLNQKISANDNKTEIIQSDVMDFADTYANTIGDALVEYSLNKDNPHPARRMALSLLLASARGAFINATEENPLTGLVNMVVLVSLQRQACDEPWFQELFGERTEAARTLMAGQEKRVWELAALYLNPSQLNELRDAIAEWRKNHSSMHIVSVVRVQDFQQARPASQGKPQMPGSVFSLLFIDPFASLDPAVREVQLTRLAAARMFYYIQRMPDLIRIQSELLYMDALSAPEITSVVNDIHTFTANTTTFAAACRDFALTIAKFPADLTVEREKTVAQLNEAVTTQRAAAVDQLADATAKEREAAIKQLTDATTKEREATIAQLTAAVDAIRKSALDQIAEVTTKERQAAIKQANDAINQSQIAALANLNNVSNDFVNHLSFKIFLAAITSALAIALIALAYRWLTTRIFPK